MGRRFGIKTALIATALTVTACATSPVYVPAPREAPAPSWQRNPVPFLHAPTHGPNLKPGRADIDDGLYIEARRTNLPPQGPFNPNRSLYLCEGIRVSNAPAHDSDNWISDYHIMIVAHGVLMAIAPVNDTCLSSGYGQRTLRGRTRLHAGIDLASHLNEPAYSAAPGKIVEARWSDSYGNLVLIEHAPGVYTRYAHLKEIDDSITAGAPIGFGQPIGLIGNTGASGGIHLHFEILTGVFGAGRLRSWSPFDFPAYEGEGYGDIIG